MGVRCTAERWERREWVDIGETERVECSDAEGAVPSRGVTSIDTLLRYTGPEPEPDPKAKPSPPPPPPGERVTVWFDLVEAAGEE
jgi:hypothetical protein